MKTLSKMSYGHYILTALKPGSELESRDKDYVAAGVVNWASQVSFDPPLMMVSVEKDSDLNETINYSRHFTLHYLGKDQSELIAKFSGDSDISDNKINGIPFEKKNQEAILTDLVGYATFKVEKFENIGDHAIYFGSLVNEEHEGGKAVLNTEDTPIQYNEGMM
ncbi:MAG: flavin reductase family protein [Vicingaceae bacterium]